MTAKEIISRLAKGTPRHVHVFPTLPSTSTTLREMASAGAEDGTAVIAETQTEGRGRLGREFASPTGAGLYLSLLLRRPIPPERLPLLTPYAAVAAAHAIESLTPLKVGIKWVNDLRIGEKKIAGILTEGEMTPEGELAYAVVGIGINLRADALPPSLSGIAAAIGDYATPPSAEVLAARLLDCFFAELPSLSDASFLEEYRRRSVVLSRRVEAIDGERRFFGVAEEILEDGALRLRTEEGTVTLRAGEVSLRL